MRISYDPEANAAYITIGDRIADGEATKQIHSIMTPGHRGEIVLDFDTDGMLLGVEALNASDVLRRSILEAAPLPGM